MTDGSTGEKIKEKVMGSKDKVKETIGMGGGSEGARKEGEGELGPGAATKLKVRKAATTYNAT
jgi:hypothetical protein